MYDSIVFLGRDNDSDLCIFYNFPECLDDMYVNPENPDEYDNNYNHIDSRAFPQIAPGELWLLDTATMDFYCVERH